MLGIETPPGSCTATVKINLLCNDRCHAIAILSALPFVAVPNQDNSDTKDLTCLVGFSARFFKGPLTNTRDISGRAIRFGIDLPPPKCLRRIHARGDNYFERVGSEARICANESDLILVLESDSPETISAALESLAKAQETHPFELRGFTQGRRRPNGIGLLGFRGAVSNLQDLRRNDPERFRRYVYVHDAKAGSPYYDGGTYLVYRKYRKNLQRWFSNQLRITDADGITYEDTDARAHIIGRHPSDNCVLEAGTGVHLSPEPDSAEAKRAPESSHIRQANPRGVATSAFGDPIVPKDVRILRRSYPFDEIDDISGERIQGLVFMCFQHDIQDWGFEYINNNWLHASGFLGRRDPLLDPDSDLIEPIDGCYYFVPPTGTYPGEVFFRQS